MIPVLSLSAPVFLSNLFPRILFRKSVNKIDVEESNILIEPNILTDFLIWSKDEEEEFY